MSLIALALFLIGIAAFVFWICMLISVIQNKGLTETEKIVWVIVVVLLHVLGALIYFIVAHDKRNTPLTPPQTP
jgi:hypothetical protein